MTKYLTIETFNIAANATAFVVTVILLVACVLGGDLKARVFRWYFVLVSLTLFSLLCDFVVLVLLSGISGDAVRFAIRTIDSINFLSMAFILYAAGMYFYEFFSTKTRVSRRFVHLQIVLAAALAVVVVASQFAPILFSLDEANNYHKEAYLWVYIFPLLTMLSCAALTLANIRLLRPREWLSLLFYTIVAVVCYVVESLVEELWVTYLGSAVILLTIYVNIQVELRHQLSEKEAELAEGRITTMLSQIRPHFIFNTLSSIADVCGENPLAQKCLVTFSDYLRGNMDALTQKTPIPFERELEHVRQYLWLEQLRFEERLRVEYDIGTSDFALPVLTLQPIVENAVRHGVTQRVSGGTVVVRTEKTEDGYRVVVEDDGVGFDPEAPSLDGRSHTGIENVRARLDALCGGRLDIESAPGRGTRVTIEVPAEGGRA